MTDGDGSLSRKTFVVMRSYPAVPDAGHICSVA